MSIPKFDFKTASFLSVEKQILWIRGIATAMKKKGESEI